MYSPSLGVWLEAEPNGAAYVDGPNLYDLEHNNPISHVDPTGCQTTTAQTPNGKFTINMAAGDVIVFNGQKITTAAGTIEFTPDKNVCPACKLIKLVQIVHTTLPNGKDMAFGDVRDKVNTTEDKAKGIMGGYHVDFSPAIVVTGKPVSIYYRDSYENKDKSHDGANSEGDPTPANLFDSPTTYVGSTQDFETYAVCVATGKVLAGIKWSMIAGASGALIAPGDEVIEPSATYTEAIKVFNDVLNKPK